MSKLPEIINPEYHEMSFEEVDKIREKIASEKVGLLIKETELLLYLNQMTKKHSFNLKMIQYLSMFGFLLSIILLFINWKISPILFIACIVAHSYNRKLAKQYIFDECSKDKVFLKFALSVGLVKLQSES